MAFPARTDKETLQRLLASGQLTLMEVVGVQRSFEAVLAGTVLDFNERLRANSLYDRCKLGEADVRAGRSRVQVRNGELAARFDAMPRPKRPPGK